MIDNGNFRIRLGSVSSAYSNIIFEGIAADDEVEATKTSNSGPGFFLSFNVDSEYMKELGEELVRAGNVLKTIGIFNEYK